jgi:hypothetical protein
MQTIYRRLLKSVGKKLAARLRKGYAQLNIRASVNRFFSLLADVFDAPNPGPSWREENRARFPMASSRPDDRDLSRPSGRFSFVERACSTPSSSAGSL